MLFARLPLLVAGAIACLLGLACAPGAAHPESSTVPPLSRFVFVEPHFGSIPVELTLYASDRLRAQSAASAAFARIAELSSMMSDYAYDPPSPLNLIAAKAPAAVRVPPALLGALARGVEHHGFTAGAFDITAKPYIQLWRVSWRLGELPPEERLLRAARLVGIGDLELDGVACTARLKRSGMWLDLGGLAKGLIGDEVVRLLRAPGRHELPLSRRWRHGLRRCAPRSVRVARAGHRSPDQ